MRRRTILLIVVGTVFLAVVLSARVLLAPVTSAVLGFGAKITCSGVLVGGATVAQVRESFPDPNLRRVVRVRVSGDTATASIPLFGRRDAVHRERLGCTLLPADGTIAPLSAPAVDERIAADTLPWLEAAAVRTLSEYDTTALRAVVDSAFIDPADGPQRRTLALLVVHGGRVIAERYAPGYGPQHRLLGWSITKSVTNALAGILHGDGLLDLNAAALRPEWSADARSGITVEHLLQMSSGLAFEESYGPTGAATRLLFNTRDVAGEAARGPLVHEPGTRWYYSSATTNLIAAHMRALLSNDAAYARFPAERLFEPAGMSSAVMEPDAAGTFVGSSFMYATARDWARFGLLFLRDGVWNGERILPEGWVTYSVMPAPAAPLGQYGAQWWLNAGESADTTRRVWPDLPRDIFWASGYQGQYIAIVPSHDVVVVRLGLTDDSAQFRLDELLRGVLRALPPAP
jgi:CubicO group peptidase (beta-lactamase class C family)